MEAKHKGFGNWTVYDGDKVVAEKLTKAEAEAMVDGGRAAGDTPYAQTVNVQGGGGDGSGGGKKAREFTFIGDADGHGPDEITYRGVTFKKGEPTLVEDPALFPKLEWNNHFK